MFVVMPPKYEVAHGYVGANIEFTLIVPERGGETSNTTSNGPVKL